MAKRVWNSGPPPHVGWWNASSQKNIHTWRWWDGKRWSIGVSRHATLQTAGADARLRALVQQDSIRWTNYWPENARVPRIDPRSSQS